MAITEAREAEYYNRIYSETKGYHTENYRNLAHFLIYVRAMQYIRASGGSWPIVELGCGTGQFAEYLEDEELTNYWGCDFSHVGITKAKERSRQHMFEYDLRNGIGGLLEKCGLQKTENIIFVALEVLEHVKDDLKIVEELPGGAQLIASVPTFLCLGHVRMFEKKEEVFERYGHLIEIVHQCQLENRWMINSIVKRKKERCSLQKKTLSIAF